MEINHDAQEGLQLCGESVRMPEKSFKKLVEIAFDIILGKKDETSFDGKNLILLFRYHCIMIMIIQVTSTFPF